ncbi:glycosyltransferase [Arthrobacter yangruifuii]|uniref:Glycosyltransferase n=1 Tax=Arthrobacter yangruifuii TaxID=2606616 RepID=A0A5N6MG80_9MICC|nr:glycosyltransferase [Arthrobacter yangruifuii]
MKTEFECSCVITTHDRDVFLRDAISSVLGQTIRPMEVIIVDDVGSKATSLLVDSLSTAALPLRYMDASGLQLKGAGASRNFGAKAATKPYVAFLDDDDIWKPTLLEECRMQFLANPTALVAVWASFLSNDKEFDGQSLPTGLRPSDGFSKNPGLTGSNFIIKREVFCELGGFDTTLWVSNDRDFLIRFLDAGHPYGVIKQRLVLQRIHQQGQLTNRNEHRARGIEHFMNKYRPRLSSRDLRLLNRELYSIRRVCHAKLGMRVIFTVRQLLTYRPGELIATITKKALNRTTTYR